MDAVEIIDGVPDGRSDRIGDRGARQTIGRVIGIVVGQAGAAWPHVLSLRLIIHLVPDVAALVDDDGIGRPGPREVGRADNLPHAEVAGRIGRGRRTAITLKTHPRARVW